jgi:hypothetical protein
MKMEKKENGQGKFMELIQVSCSKDCCLDTDGKEDN